MPAGSRIRTDNVSGTVTDNPLTIAATTLNSAGLANLAAVSSAHAVIVLDPLRTAGAPEIVIVTAHTGAATSATITRGAYGTAARQHAQGTLWVHAPTIEDTIRIVTSAARPSDPYEGQVIFETDTDVLSAYNGSAWLNVNLLADPPACRAYHNVNQSLTDGVETVLAFNSENYDTTGTMHDPAVNNSRITMPRAGLYLVQAGVALTSGADYAVIYMYPRLNATDQLPIVNLQANAVAIRPNLNYSCVWKFAANDYIELVVNQDNTANTARNVEFVGTAGSRSPFFAATWLGRG